MNYLISYPSASDCQTNVPPYQCNPCPDREKAGITSVALIHKSFTFMNISDEAEWLTGIQLGKIKFIPRTRGNYDGGTAKYGDGYGRIKQRLLGYDYKLQFKDEDFLNNSDFYDSLDESNEWQIAWFTGSLVWLSRTAVTIAVKDTVAEDIEQDVIWDCEVSWFYKDKPLKKAAPQGIAESCMTLASGSGSGGGA